MACKQTALSFPYRTQWRYKFCVKAYLLKTKKKYWTNAYFSNEATAASGTEFTSLRTGELEWMAGSWLAAPIGFMRRVSTSGVHPSWEVLVHGSYVRAQCSCH